MLMLAAPRVAHGDERGSLKVTVTSLRSDRGVIRVALYRSATGFPGDSKKVFRHLAAPVKRGVASVTFGKLPHGVYAAAVVHDENRNNRMDKNWLGIPTEGIGASNNATRMFGPPRFKECRFRFTNSRQSIAIRMRYYL
jgi:uncharacterized protein (DUF2141 family)